MAKAKLRDGVTRVGHIIDPNTGDLRVASVKFDARGVLIERPYVDERFDAFSVVVDGRQEVPTHLCFVDTSGRLVLADLQEVGHSASSIGVAAERTRAWRVIESGADTDFAEIDGMDSEIDGLADWASLSTVSTSIKFTEGAPTFVIRAANPDAVVLGGPLNAQITTSFTPVTQPKGNVFSVTDLVHLKTRSEGPRPWVEHQAVHRMFQDLMSLAYGKPSFAQVHSVMREDDQEPRTDDGTDRRWWRRAYEPSFGRRSSHVEAIVRGEDEPLFRLENCDPHELVNWIANYELWSRATWIAVSPMFQTGTTIETSLLQMGVALESLGFAIAVDEARDAQHHRTPSNSESYVRLLRRVTRAVGFEHPLLYGDQGSEEWVRSFNKLFKGTKHADNPLPDPMTALDAYTQAQLLVRVWLARRLGVAEDKLKESLSRLR